MRAKRWKPTVSAQKIIRECALRVATTKRVSYEIAERVHNVTSECSMDLRYLRPDGVHNDDLSDKYSIATLRSGKLRGPQTEAPMVELWVYDIIGFGADAYHDLADQIIVQFDNKGDVVSVRATSANAKPMWERK